MFHPVATCVKDRVFGFKKGELRIYRRMDHPNGPEEAWLKFVGLTKTAAAGVLYKFLCTNYQHEERWIATYTVNAEGFPMEMEMIVGRASYKLAFNLDAIYLTQSKEASNTVKRIPIPAKFRDDYRSRERFFLSLSIPVAHFIPVLQMIRDQSTSTYWTALAFWVDDNGRPGWAFAPVTLKRRRRNHFALPDGRRVVAYQYEAMRQGSSWVGARMLVDPKTGIVYEAAWRNGFESTSPHQWGLMAPQ